MVIWSVAWAAWIYDLSWYVLNLPSSVAFFWPSYYIGIGGDIEGVTSIPALIFGSVMITLWQTNMAMEYHHFP